MQKTLFDTLEISHFQQLKDLSSMHLKFQWIEELSSTHFHIETWYFQKTWRTSFSRLKNLQHFEEIFSTPPTHLEMDSYFLCNLAN
jgi:hypothetical protein